jgi:hypothetical protein
MIFLQLFAETPYINVINICKNATIFSFVEKNTHFLVMFLRNVIIFDITF